MRTVFAVAVSAVLSLVAAQSSNITIDPNSVDQGTRVSWCTSEFNTCAMLCPGGQTKLNNCEFTNLTYTCTCADGTTPAVASYQGTLPFFICQQAFANCIKQYENNASGQQSCKDTYKCATQTASAVAASTSAASTSASSTASPTASATSTAKPNAANSESVAIGSGLLAGVVMVVANVLL